MTAGNEAFESAYEETSPLAYSLPLAGVHAMPGSVTTRWARFVLAAIKADRDPKTIGDWARAVGVSRSALCECCRLVHVSPHNARDFARIMRAIFRSGRTWQPETVLDLADTRTLRKLLGLAGFSGNERLTPTPLDFLARQMWIPQDNTGLLALRSLLFGVEDNEDETIR
jgi:hypothetical protein